MILQMDFYYVVTLSRQIFIFVQVITKSGSLGFCASVCCVRVSMITMMSHAKLLLYSDYDNSFRVRFKLMADSQQCQK